MATTRYVSKQAGASDSNNGLATTTPFLTLAKGMSVTQAGDTLLFRAGDTWIENFVITGVLSGTASAHTTFGAFGTLGNAKAKIQAVNAASQACLLMTSGPVQYIDFNDLELTNNSTTSSTTAVTGEHVVETPIGSGGAQFITFSRCYIHGSGNCCIESYNGPTPRSTAGNGSGNGDDSDWTLTDCEFYNAANSLIINHGSRWFFNRCHFHLWGQSNNTYGRHAVYGNSVNSNFFQCYFHNDEAVNPTAGQAVSNRVTGVTVSNCIFHDCIQGYSFWYDNVRGVSLFVSNRMWNMYGGAFYFAAVSDTGPLYTWAAGSTPVDKFVFANNTIHFQSGGPMLALTDPSAVYIGGLVFVNNIVIGPYTQAIQMSPFAANSGVTGALIEKNNVWIATGTNTAGTFTYSGTGHTLASWQATTVSGILQGANSFYTATPGLGSAPAGDSRRAFKPYQVLGVVQTQADNALINSFGAPDFFPLSGAAVINQGTTSVDASVTYTFS